MIWVLIVSFVALTPLLLTATSRAEERLDKDRKLYWSDYPNSAWYLFGTFLGQAGTDFDYEFKTWALRCRTQKSLLQILLRKIPFSFLNATKNSVSTEFALCVV